VTYLACLLRQALRGMRSSALIQLGAVGSIAMGLLLVGLVAVLVFNVSRLTAQWGRGTHVIAYLEPGLAQARVDRLATLLRQRPEVGAVTHVSAARARQLLGKSLGPHDDLLEAVEPGFLPASLEVRLKAVDEASARALVALLASAQGVEEVDHLGRWADRLGSFVALLRGVGSLVALIVGLACLYVVTTAIRLGIHARRREIEIQRLVGATGWFVRGPFLIEGALQGMGGALLAAGLLYLACRAVFPDLESAIETLMTRLDLVFLTPLQLLVGLGGSALLGLLGSRLAVRRYVDV